MKLGVSSKLFLAFLGACVAVVLAMAAAARLSFTHGFLSYLNEQTMARMAGMVPRLQAIYRETGSWSVLRGHPHRWGEVFRPQGLQDGSLPNPLPAPPVSDMTGASFRITLLDAQHQYVMGNPDLDAHPHALPIKVDGKVVGYLAMLPFQQVTGAGDLRFQSSQLHSIWLITALAVLLAILLALWLARTLMAPIKRVAAATHRLAGGDYSPRVEVHTRDEIGRLAIDFNRLAQTLERNESARRAFMADISHELRTPLSVLRGELEAIEDGVREPTPATLRSLQAEVSLLGKLVSDLHDLSLAEVGALTYRTEPVDLPVILRATLDPLRERFREHGLVLDTSAIGPQSLFVRADEGRLHQLFGNLAENALRYTHAGGFLRVRLRRLEHDACIDFSDSAPGVPDSALPRLFERFFRSEPSRNRRSGGSGLGLAICKNIVEAHGGSIRASAADSGGLCIEVRLPLLSTRHA